MTNTKGHIKSPAKGIESITHDTVNGVVHLWVAVSGSTNMRAAENIARGYLRKEEGQQANVMYIGRYGVSSQGTMGYRFIGI